MLNMEISNKKTFEEIQLVIDELNEKSRGLEREQRAIREQMVKCEEVRRNLLKQEKEKEEKDLGAFADNYMKACYGIENYKDAANDCIMLVFDKSARFIKIARSKVDFDYLGGDDTEDERIFENWLRQNKLYCHAATSFYNRPKVWYDKTFKEQLENLGWTFSSKTGKLIKTRW